MDFHYTEYRITQKCSELYYRLLDLEKLQYLAIQWRVVHLTPIFKQNQRRSKDSWFDVGFISSNVMV